ncbi:CRISPR-associated helicase Cas3' [Methylovulum psychrotolerans]|uniref:CRISPR-associated helicase Cas3' n=1 Tax=Methylovulum psychrotolerans TaxID=1704499 RepID=UPI002044D567|nr:CRISPR-associated helicase Cas3' [Methylovulum psychrotolerans]
MINGIQAPYYRYWGKAQKDSQENDDTPKYHLLPYHCLDVAAVGWHLLAPDKPTCKQLAMQLQVTPEWLRTFFTFCLVLHDLGKFSRAFQGLRTDLSLELVKAKSGMCYTERHDSLGFCLWRDVLAKTLPEFLPAELGDTFNAAWLSSIESWLEIVTGHHGMPPKNNVRIQNFFEVEDEQAAMGFVMDAITLLLTGFDFQPLLDNTLKKRLKPLSWQLAGIAVLADWLGSNQDYFEYCNEIECLAVYWQKTVEKKAEETIKSLPKTPKVAAFQGIKKLFDFIQEPTPLQKYAITEPLTQQSQLFILEDVTGAGKTEAALILTQRLMAQGLADGLYIALPTMATANAMYQRLGSVYRKFFQANNQPSLILAHGARELSQDFQDSVAFAEQMRTDSDYQSGNNEADQELSATTYCNAWLADSRKKALLADVGVGTLDQALLAVLPARHQSLRLLGLGRKVLLVDEVHAYDSYMQKLLDALLEAHARQGGSVILLSATLPQTMRENLVAAYHKGLGKTAPALDYPAQYPLATHTPAAQVEQPIDTRQAVKRTVQVKRLGTEADVLAQIQQAITTGQCVCWIRNTVKSARQSYQNLLDAGIAPEQLSLFHSRFAMIDRQAIENRTLAQFGRDSTHQQRTGQILIASQVVEQSLDLDLDVMITDLAPIDLIIQRAGRLRRHNRDALGNRLAHDTPDQRGVPILYLHCPEPTLDADANWLKPDHSGTQAVYPHIGQLWLTAKQLMDKGRLTMPDDARGLIEGVYSWEAEDALSQSLQEASQAAIGKAMSYREIGNMNALDLAKGYTRKSAEKSGGWDEETNIPTRLTDEETVSVALAIVENAQLKPYAQAERYAWSLSTVKLPEREWKKAQQQISADMNVLIEALKAEQKAVRWLEVLPLSEGQTIYSAQQGFIG